MPADRADHPDLPLEELRGSLSTICWGGFLAGGIFAAIDPFRRPDQPSTGAIVGVIGVVMLLIGLRKLPFTDMPDRFRALRDGIVGVVVVSLVTAIAGMIPVLRTPMAATSQIATWLWSLLLIALIGQLVGHLHLGHLRTAWRRLTATWLVVGIISIAGSALIAFTFEPTDSTGSSLGWQSTSVLEGHDASRWWVVGGIVALWIAAVAPTIALIVLAVRTMRLLRSDVADSSRSAVTVSRSVHSPGEDLTGAPGARLRKDGDRVVYLVDPD